MIAKEKKGLAKTFIAILKEIFYIQSPRTQYVFLPYLLIGLKGERRNRALVAENLSMVPPFVITIKVLLSA